MSAKQRRKYARSTAARRAMCRFLRVVEAKANAETWDVNRYALHRIFMKYDSDGSCHLDSAQFTAMVSDIVAIKTDDDLGKVMSFVEELIVNMDRNKNKLIEEDEFATWCLDSLKMSKSDREVLHQAENTKINAKFIDAIESLMKVQYHY